MGYALTNWKTLINERTKPRKTKVETRPKINQAIGVQSMEDETDSAIPSNSPLLSAMISANW
jgi:hypothetical protein